MAFVLREPESDPSINIPGDPASNISKRQNNPFNLKGKVWGASDVGSKGFAIYDTPEAGVQAGIKQIKLDQSRGLTFSQFAEKYAPSYENPTWKSDVSKMLGIKDNTPISKIPTAKLVNAVVKRESSTNIENLEEKVSKVADVSVGRYKIREAPTVPPPAATQQVPPEQAQGAGGQGQAPQVAPQMVPGGFGGQPDRPGLMKAQAPPSPSIGQLIAGKIAPTVEAGATALGGVLGTAAGPVGTVVGTALGYGIGQQAGKGLKQYAGEKKPETVAKAMIEGGKDLATGTMIGLGGEIGGPILQKGLGGFGTLLKQSLGKLSGVGTGAVETALKGGENFVKALRGKISGEEVVDIAKSSLQELKNKRSIEYTTKLTEIGKMTGELDTAPIQNKLRDLMKAYNIKITPEGELDFSTVKIGDKGRADIKKMTETVWDWKDKTPKGLDALKGYLADFYSESSQARAFTNSLTRKVGDTIQKAVPQYTEMTRPYAEATALIKDIESGLVMRKQGMTGRVTSDMTLRRLTSAMRDNFSLRKELVDILGVKSGQDVAGAVAGHAMSPMLGRGLAGYIQGGEVAFGLYFNPKVWPLVAAASPRLQGEFLRMYGKALKETMGASLPVAKIMAYMGAAKKEEGKTKVITGAMRIRDVLMGNVPDETD